jgi:hypothetical protein
MLYRRAHYYRLITEAFNQPRRSFTQIRQLEDLQQLYELLKHESLCKTSFFFLNYI